MRLKVISAVVGFAIAPVILAQDQHQDHQQPAQPAAAAQQQNQEATHAVAVIHPLGDSKSHGTVKFTKEANGIRVVADIEGLPANTTRGFHIHEFGDCSAPDGSSAGGHYNPEQTPHAGPDAQQRHAGDLGNIKSDDSGKAHLDVVLTGISINGPKNPIVGRAVILHEKQDDLKSQPTGDAGGRVACGVIGIAKGD